MTEKYRQKIGAVGRLRSGRVCVAFKVACRNFQMSAAEVYKKTRKVPDLFWNAYVCRPIAAVLVSAIQGTRITPNQITLSAVLVALVSVGLLLALPGHAGLVAGVVVFELSYVLDCADGMLARWRGTASPVGHLLDFLMDELKAFLLLAAVAVRLFREHADALFLLLGLFGLVALASGIALTTFVRRPEVMGPAVSPSAPAAPRSLLGRAVGLVESGAKFLIHYPSYLLYVALIGRIELYFLPYVAVNALYAARAFAGVAWRYGRS
jgi:phosphatidylglycerophosphate synthase